MYSQLENVTLSVAQSLKISEHIHHIGFLRYYNALFSSKATFAQLALLSVKSKKEDATSEIPLKLPSVEAACGPSPPSLIRTIQSFKSVH